MNLFRSLLLACTLVGVTTLSACGQVGPLYLPDDSTKTSNTSK